MKLSLCMIVKNEEEVIRRCLDSTRDLFDEIIIVDTGSTDKTKEIVKDFTNNIYDFKWVNDFSKARNFSFSKATSDYIMWLDADDVITQENYEKLKQLKNSLNGETDCYMLKYAIAFNALGESTFVYYRERILKNNKTFIWNDPVHEVITPSGKISYEEIEIHHKKIKQTPSDRNLKIYEEYIKNGSILSARQTFYYARELFYNAKYNESIIMFNNFLENKSGWLENKIEACLMKAKCYTLLKQEEHALKSLFESFLLDTPRAEILCEIVGLLLIQKKYKLAIHWAKTAKKIKINYKSGAFINPECYSLIPNIQLCVAYYNLGNIKLSKRYNTLALKENPQNMSAVINKQLFDKLDQQKKVKI